MKCVYCGAELRDGCLFCSHCGKEAQIVPDYNVLEDDYLKAILEEENSTSTKRTLTEREKQAAAKKKQEEIALKKAKQKKIIIISVVAAVCVLAILIAVIVKISLDQEHAGSYEYQIGQAEQAYRNGDTEKAVSYYENALSIVPDDIDVRLILGEIFMEQKDYDSALVLYQEILNLDSGNLEAYRNLITIYEAKDDIDAIVALSDGVSEEKILALFSEYMVTPPLFSEKSGTYEDYMEIGLSADKSYEIYYTMDGTDPVKYGTKYTEPIPLDEMDDYEIRAVSLNEKGIYSEVVTGKFKIEIPAPEMPVVSPDGGDFGAETQVTVSVPKGCTAYYTWDGTDPNVTSEPYTGPMTVPEGNHVLSVILIDDKTEQMSDIYRGNFIYYEN